MDASEQFNISILGVGIKVNPHQLQTVFHRLSINSKNKPQEKHSIQAEAHEDGAHHFAKYL